MKEGGLVICMILFLIFMIFKLCGIITWSWVWVTAPIWIPLSIVFIIVMITMMAYFTVKR